MRGCKAAFQSAGFKLNSRVLNAELMFKLMRYFV
jgi:hypothetical protein